jgi:hypothetical protein
MPTIADNDPLQLPDQHELLNQRLADAANYAVLRRIAPALRHDVAGLMQPVGMMMMVLQRRVQMAEPDLSAMAKNIASAGALAKDATTGCMNAIGWMAAGEGTHMNLRNGINEVSKLLESEFSAAELKVVNEISDDQVTAPQNFLRSVVIGALLAFCDQRTPGTTLTICLERENNASGDLLAVRMLPVESAVVPVATDTNRKYRPIDWPDVEAMAGSLGVAMVRGNGWLTLALPN